MIRQSYDQPVTDTAQHVVGKTHYGEVLRESGPPAKVSALGGGMVFLYEQAALQETQFGINIKIRDVPLIKIVLGHGHADRQATVLVFDEEGLLRGIDQETWRQDLGGGGGVQPVLAVVPVTDPGGLNESPATHDWGAALLESTLPVALNRQSSLETGRGGIQQMGTPTSMGQHALELQGAEPLP